MTLRDELWDALSCKHRHAAGLQFSETVGGGLNAVGYGPVHVADLARVLRKYEHTAHLAEGTLLISPVSPVVDTAEGSEEVKSLDEQCIALHADRQITTRSGGIEQRRFYGARTGLCTLEALSQHPLVLSAILYTTHVDVNVLLRSAVKGGLYFSRQHLKATAHRVHRTSTLHAAQFKTKRRAARVSAINGSAPTHKHDGP